MDWKPSPVLEESGRSEPTKPTEPGFDGFVGATQAPSPKIAAVNRQKPRGFVTLKPDVNTSFAPILPVEAFELALELERRGIPLATDANHQFIVPQNARLTDTDYLAITRWRRHLAVIVEYRAPEVS